MSTDVYNAMHAEMSAVVDSFVTEQTSLHNAVACQQAMQDVTARMLLRMCGGTSLERVIQTVGCYMEGVAARAGYLWQQQRLGNGGKP